MDGTNNSENIELTLNTLLTPRYPELSFEVQMYNDRNPLTYEYVIKTNIWITTPKGFYKTKPIDDIYYDNVEQDIRDILKMFGIFRHVNPNWLEDKIRYYRDF